MITELKTTFRQDFKIADIFGVSAIKDTYNRTKKEWQDNIEYMAELTAILNWAIWDWYEKNEEIARVYNDLWQDCEDFCYEHFIGEDLKKYLDIID